MIPLIKSNDMKYQLCGPHMYHIVHEEILGSAPKSFRVKPNPLLLVLNLTEIFN